MGEPAVIRNTTKFLKQHDDDYLLISANEVVVVVEVKSDTMAGMVKSIGTEDNIRARCLLSLSTILDEGEGLHLLDGGICCVFLSPVEGIILLGHFQTEYRVAEEYTDSHYRA